MKKNLYALSFLWIIMFTPVWLMAQRTITGTIMEQESEIPLIGANIMVVGTSVGTVTDIDGKYSLTVPDGANQIKVSYTGYAEQVIELGVSNVVDVKMTEGALLDEVVVIGYGTVKREDATGAITTIDQKAFNKGAINSPQELLAGKVAGVQITSNSGAPGEGSTIRIRGGSSLNATNDPLIVIDGVPIDSEVGDGALSGSRNPLNFINPNDIETFTVLKDASATAIYGNRASNGVILITTKKGSAASQGVSVTYNGDFSVSEIVDQADVFSADEFREYVRQQNPAAADTLLGNADTNWQDEIYQTAIGHNHNLGFSGNIKSILPYRVSLGYTNRRGILRTDEFERTNIALNLNPQFFDNRLQVNFSTKYMNINNRFANRDAIGAATTFNPTLPVRSGNERFEGYTTITQQGNDTIPNGLAPANPLGLLELRNDRSTVNRVIISGSADYRFKFLPELRANINLAYDRSNGSGTTDVPATASFAFDAANGGGTDNEFDETRTNELLETYLNYRKDLGDMEVDIMAGYSWQRFYEEKFDRQSNLAGTPELTNVLNDRQELFLLSYFGRAQINLYDRFLFTGTVRRDGSSRFADGNRWGTFPAAAFAWKAVNTKRGVLDNLKVRLGYGVTGQQGIGGFYPTVPVYEQNEAGAFYFIGEEFINTLRPNGYNEDLQWEETTTYNVGVDYGLFNNRVFGSLEYYFRETENLLNFVFIPVGTNLTNQLDVNIGTLTNEGLEFAVNFIPVQTEKINWLVNFNVTANRNEITKLTAVDDPEFVGNETGGIAGGTGNNIQINSVGHPARSFYVYEQVYDTDGTPIEGAYVDRNEDGVIDNRDLYRFENPAPDYFLGISSTFDYGAWSFSFAGRANIGNHVYNNLQSDQSATARLVHPTVFLVNGLTDVQQIDFVNQRYLSDHFVQNASFFRMDFVSLAYRMDELLQNKIGLTLSLTVQNPFVISNYSGIDPEIENGIDNNFYPRARTFVLGANARF